MITDSALHRRRRRHARDDRSGARRGARRPRDADVDWIAERRHPRDRVRGRRQADRQPPRARTASCGSRANPAASTSARDGRPLARHALGDELAPTLARLLREAQAASRSRCRCSLRRRSDGAAPGLRFSASSAVHSSSSRRSAAWPGSSDFDQRPESRRVIELDQVRDLVRDDVFGERRRQLHQPPVETDLALGVAASPFAARVGQPHRRAAARAIWSA